LSTVPAGDGPAGDGPAGPPPRDARPAGHSAASAVPARARPFQGRRAGLVSRVLANTVDFGVVVAIVAVGYAVVAALRFLWRSWTFSFPAPSFLLLLLLGGLAAVLYMTASWVTTGRTYGDHLLGLRVVGARGRPLRVGSALVRALLCVVFPVGLFWAIVSRENRSLQDVVLRSSVIYDWSKQAPDEETG
jgi:uncharacterized RDD family membrane protein YckC